LEQLTPARRRIRMKPSPAESNHQPAECGQRRVTLHVAFSMPGQEVVGSSVHLDVDHFGVERPIEVRSHAADRHAMLSLGRRQIGMVEDLIKAHSTNSL
jgi:hypothetical protein